MIKKIDTKSTTDRVIEYLRKLLEKGAINPGDQLEERALADKLGVSRTPIREALIKLQHEGIVEIQPRKGILIKKISSHQMRQIYQTIAILESEAVILSIDSITPKDIDKMEKLIREMKKAAGEKRYKAYLKLNHLLHKYPVDCLGNEYISQSLQNLYRKLYNLPRSLNEPEVWIDTAIKDHEKMLTLIEEKNSEELRSFIRNTHWGPDRIYHQVKEA